jgi:hypothetical protein
VARNIYNLKPIDQEVLRLGVPLFGSVTRGGAALVLPVREVTFRLRGSVRARIRGRLRRRAL